MLGSRTQGAGLAGVARGPTNVSVLVCRLVGAASTETDVVIVEAMNAKRIVEMSLQFLKHSVFWGTCLCATRGRLM